MSLRKYNRNLSKRILNNNLNNHFGNLIEDKLEIESWDEAVESFYEEGRRLQSKSNFAENYLKEKDFSECSNCSYSDCYLTNRYECGEIGIEIEEKYSKGDVQIFGTKEIPKYTWMNTREGCLVQVAKGHEEKFLRELTGNKNIKFLR